MCGFFTHGFWWKTEVEYVVVADWEINSHTEIRAYRKDLIPTNAKRWGFNPINGEPVTNESVALPNKVKEKIHLLREIYFPNKEAIADWMRKNYGKQNDENGWRHPLLEMLGDEGIGLFSIKYCEKEIKDYEWWIKNRKQEIKNYEQEIKNCEQEIKNCEQEIKNCEQEIKNYEQEIKNCEQEIKNYEQRKLSTTGTLDTVDIDKFIAYFLEHPNSYWADRTQERKVEYKSFVQI